MQSALSHLEDAYKVACDDLLNLSAEIHIYRQLFVHNDSEKTALLNDAAGAFFFIAQQSLFQTIVMRLTRFAEKGGSGKNAKLSLDHLVQASRKIANSDQSQRLVQLRREFCSKAKRAIPLRNKIFAHSDLAHAMAGTRSRFGLSMKEIRASYDTAATLLNEVGSLLDKPFMVFDLPEFGLAGRDGEALVETLRRAQQYAANQLK